MTISKGLQQTRRRTASFLNDLAQIVPRNEMSRHLAEIRSLLVDERVKGDEYVVELMGHVQIIKKNPNTAFRRRRVALRYFKRREPRRCLLKEL